MSDRLVPLRRIVDARAVLAGRIHRTPLLSSRTAADLAGAAAAVRLADARIYLKPENLQKTGSFKPRAAINRLAALTAAHRERGAITVSAGNAAQAYAWAAREVGVRMTVVMPTTAVGSKVEACLGYGADVVLHGETSSEAFARADEIRAERNLTFTHPFDQPEVIAGNGTIGLEILDDLPGVDVVVVAIGGGGLISGVATALKEMRPDVRVYGVEPDRSNAMSLALAAGEPVRIVPRSVADGLGSPFAGEWTLPICQRYLDGVVLLDDPMILAGVRFAIERLKLVLEPAGAAALAALLFGRIPIRDGDRVCAVLSGGNVEVTRLGELLAMGAPLPADPTVAGRV